DHVTALGILHNVISRQETAHPDAVIVAAYKQLLKRAPTVSKTMLCACSTAFVTEDIGEYKKARYNLCKSIRKAERDYSLRLEGYYTTADSRRMWHITEYRQRKGILDMPLALSSAEVRMALRKTNPRKAAGPDNIPGWALMVCSLELADMFMDIYNLSLAQALVPTCFKSTTIIPLPRKNTVTCLNDYRPVALTPIAMKCLERIVMSHIKRNIPTTLDQFQFAYRQNRSTEDGVNTAIHTALTHLEGRVLSPLLYTLFTYDCVASQTNTKIIKFADDATVIGLITGGEETNLSLNTDKTKEMIIDPRRRRREQHNPIYIGETEVERVKTFKFLGTYISEDFTWCHNTQ
ncbi:hypothetical protein QTP86_031921, partial [Hemibagrus guttatus]